MTSFVSLANWMCIKCEKRWSRATKVSRNLQSQLLGSLKRVWMCESLLAIAFNCQVVPLVFPMRFECSLRSVSVCGVWGENPLELSGKPVVHQWASQGWNWLYGRPLGNWGVSVEGVSKKWIKQAAHLWGRITFYTPLQTLSSLSIIPLVNSPFHLIPMVLHVTSSYTDSIEIELNSGVIYMCTTSDKKRISVHSNIANV